MSREQRQFIRITVQIPATLSLYQIDSFRHGHLANICAGGCFFPARDSLPVGERCQVTLTIGEGINSMKMSLAAVIVRSDSSGAGLQFVDLSPSEQAHLDALLASYHPAAPAEED